MADRDFKLIRDNYIYIQYGQGEVGEYVLIPSYPDQLKDDMVSTFISTTALSRSAPTYSYSNSGPRTVAISVELHRDMFDQINLIGSNITPYLDEDYVDTIVRKLQAIAVPRYNSSSKAVQPPMVAVRFGNELFIKGIVTGSITVSYDKPILEGGRYAKVSIGFTVTEVDPYDADTVAEKGSFRGITRTFQKGIYS